MSTEKKTVDNPFQTTNRVILIVEGKEDSLDPTVLGELFDEEVTAKNIRVWPAGSCDYINNAAAAFQANKSWFFLIDRDHYHHEKTEELNWNNFSEGRTNLLIWPKRELENYFLDADFLLHLPEATLKERNKATIENKIQSICQHRLFLDVANYVIASLRKEWRTNMDENMSPFRNSDIPENATRQDLLKILLNLNVWKDIQPKVNQLTAQSEIERRFNIYHKKMVGDSNESLTKGKGKWLDMISGKDVLNELFNQTGFFAKKIADGRPLTINDMAKQLLEKTPENELPPDFVDLRNTVIQRAKQVIN